MCFPLAPSPGVSTSFSERRAPRVRCGVFGAGSTQGLPSPGPPCKGACRPQALDSYKRLQPGNRGSPAPPRDGGSRSWGAAAATNTPPPTPGAAQGRRGPAPAHLGGLPVVLPRVQHPHVDAQTAEGPPQPPQHAVTHHAEGPGRDLRGRVLRREHLQHSLAQQPGVWPTRVGRVWGRGQGAGGEGGLPGAQRL